MSADKLKADLAERLFKYLNETLDPTVKAGISSTQMREILHGVVDWVYQSKYLETAITHAVQEAAKAKGVTLEKPKVEVSTDDFLNDLAKL